MTRNIIIPKTCDTIQIVGTGDPVVDTAAIDAAEADLIAAGGGKIRLIGEVGINAYRTIGAGNAPISFVGCGRDQTRLVLYNSAYLAFYFEGFLFPENVTTIGAVTNPKPGWSTAIVPGLTVERGDYIYVWSEDIVNDRIFGATDNLNGLQWHMPGELVRVAAYDPGTGTLEIDGLVIDQMTEVRVNPKVPYGNIDIGHFSVAPAPGNTSARCISMRYAHNAHIQDITFEDGFNNNAHVGISGSMDCTISDIWAGQAVAITSGGSCVNVGAGSTNVLFENISTEIRHHAFDTSAETHNYSGQAVRTGTPRQIRVNNFTVRGRNRTGDIDSGANQQLWTHEAGYDIHFDNFKVDISGAASRVYAGGTRSRKTRFTNGTVIYTFTGGQPGMTIRGNDCIIEGCRFIGTWRPIITGAAVSAGAIIKDCIFENNRGGITTGSDWTIEGNVFRETEGNASCNPNAPMACIKIPSTATGVRINRNDMPYTGSELAAIYVEVPAGSEGTAPTTMTDSIHGNSVDGYPGGNWVYSGQCTPPRVELPDPGLMALWGPDNYT